MKENNELCRGCAFLNTVDGKCKLSWIPPAEQNKRVKVGSCDDAGVMTGDGVVPATAVIVPSSWLSKPNS